jgi:hypothetical protein
MVTFLERDYLLDEEIHKLLKAREGKYAFLAFVLKENIEMSLSEMFQILGQDPPNPKIQNDIIDMFIKNLFAVPFGMMFDKMKEKRYKIDQINASLKDVFEKGESNG